VAKLPRVFLCLLLSGTLASAQQYVISTFAGGGPPPSPVPALSAAIGGTYGIGSDAVGNVYFTALNCVFKMDRSGILTRIAGNGRAGFSGDGGPATSAELDQPEGVAVDSAGNVYIADTGNQRLRKVTPDGTITTAGAGLYFYGVAADTFGNVYASTGGRVERISPDGTQTQVAGGGPPPNLLLGYQCAGNGEPATKAYLNTATGIAVDSAGNLYIADSVAGCVLKVDTRGTITALIGNLNDPVGLAVDNAGNLYIADFRNGVRKLSNGSLTTVATSLSPVGVAVDGTGNLYVTEQGGSSVSQVNISGVITTVAGNGTPAYWGDGGQAIKAGMRGPNALGLDGAGNVYINDAGDGRIRRVSTDGIISTFATATVSDPGGIAVDSQGNIYVTGGPYGPYLQMIAPGGTITTIAGNGILGYSGDGGPATLAEVVAASVAPDSANDIYFTDYYNVRKVSSDGIITTVAGNGTYGYSGDGGPATGAQLDGSFGITVDDAGDLYIAGLTHTRKVSPSGIITTTAGNDAQGHIGGVGVAVDGAGNLFILAPLGNGVRVSKVSSNGIISTLVNNQNNGYSGDGGPSNNSQFDIPDALAVDAAGNIYVADTGNDVVRVLRPTKESQPVVDAITNGASNIAAPLAPGEIFVLYGEGMGPPQLATMQLNEAGLADTTLAETQVLFNGTPAPLVYTSSNQLAAIVPYSVQAGADGRADMQVSYQGHTTNPMPVLIVASSPALFTLNASGQGQAAAVNQDGTINRPSNPAPAGSYISLYATGEGATSPAGVDGKLATAPLPSPILPVNVTVADQPATVQYAGAAPGEVAGVMQVNIQIPAGTPSGNVPVALTIGTAASQSGVTIAVSAN
jgi:uncharacterized protein (TIGR03437 family)